MKTLGFELIDSGFEVAVGRAPASGGAAAAERLAPPGTAPAMALTENGALHFGNEADGRRFLAPRQMCETFWDELSLQPSPLRMGGRALSFSELAFHFVSHLVNGLPGVAAGHESAVVALPPAFMEATPRAEEQLGILLGICGELELKVSALVDVASAALLDPEGRPPARGHALVVDLGLHAAQLSLIDVGAVLTRCASARVPGAGWLAVVETARRALSARFLRQTSFDVSADRRTEQEFHDETRAALETLVAQPEAWLRITSTSRERAISVPRDAVATDLKALAETIAQAAADLVSSAGRDLPGAQILLTARARQLAGLASALRSRGGISVEELGPGAAARGAAVLACTRSSPADLGDVPLEHSLPLPQDARDPAVAARAAFALHRGAARRDQSPTHVVIEGIARPLRGGGLRIGIRGEGRTVDCALSIVPSGVGPCEIVVQPGPAGWTVAVSLSGGMSFSPPGAETPMAAGDSLEVHGAPGMARLLFIRVEG
jgi:hypothetical protein